MKNRSRWLSPYVVMSAVLLMYGLKVVLKLWIGRDIHSPTITGDGFHNVADIFEALAVLVVVVISRMPPNERYPYGRKSFENIVRSVIGGGLFITALHFAATSVMGIASYLPEVERSLRETSPFGLPRPKPLIMGGDILWVVVLITLGSALLSFTFSWYEIRAGKVNGHASMVADGQETLNDGIIESSIFIGICAEYALGWVWIEYPLGLGVAFLVARTGRELFTEGLAGLLQRSLGPEVENPMREVCLSIHGVGAVRHMKTFRVGSTAICNIEMLTDAPATAHDDIKAAVRQHLAKRLAELGNEDAEFYLSFSNLPAAESRVAYAALTDGYSIVVARSVETATHFVLCDLVNGEVVCWTLEPRPTPTEPDLVTWLVAKRVRRLYVFGDSAISMIGAIPVSSAPSFSLWTLGLPKPTSF